MMEEKDYVLRTCHEMVRMIMAMVFHRDVDAKDDNLSEENAAVYRKLLLLADSGEINEAENLLSEYYEPYRMEYFKMALMFYEHLNRMEDEFLAEHDFSRTEIADGIKYTADFYGYGHMADIFLEED